MGTTRESAPVKFVSVYLVEKGSALATPAL